MTDWKKVRGLRAMVEDAVEHGTRAVERVHRGLAARPFDVLEAIPGVATPTKVVRVVHDASLTVTYGAIRAVNKVVNAGLSIAVDQAEAASGGRDAAAAEPDEKKA